MNFTDDRTRVDDTEPLEVTRAGRLTIAVAAGLALGALGLAAYAYLMRIPSGQTGGYSAPAAHYLLISLIGVCVGGLATVLLSRRALSRHHTAGWVSVLLAVVVAVAAYGVLAAEPSHRALLISGPGARPVAAIAQASWMVLAGAVLLLLAGATATSSSPARRPGRVSVTGLAVTGVVLAVVTGVVVSSISSVGASSATTAARIPIPPIPTSVGDEVAYALKLDSNWVLPAGPGFAAISDGAAIGYDGTTGAVRWRFPLRNVPAGCDRFSLFSTGTADDSVVVLQCSRPPNDQDADRYNPDREGYVSFLVGLDAVTGQQLWLNDENWRLQGRANVDADVLAAVSPDRIAALDPRTGRPLWTKERPDDHCSSSVYQPIGASVVFVDACRKTVHTYDADSNNTIDLTRQPDFPGSEGHLDLLAVDENTLLLQANDRNTRGNVLVSIDTATTQAHVTPAPYVRTPRADALIPGPVIELDDDYNAKTLTLYLPTERRTVTVTGLNIDGDIREQQWARVGDEFVTAAAHQSYDDKQLATVPVTGGPAKTRPNPCGDRLGGVVVVPDAVLVVCANLSRSGSVTDYDVLGLQ